MGLKLPSLWLKSHSHELYHQRHAGPKLPWALVLFGVMIALVLELSGVSSLAFAVGVYLLFSTSTRFSGGLYAGSWISSGEANCAIKTSIKSNWRLIAIVVLVLLASGYIAGGACGHYHCLQNGALSRLVLSPTGRRPQSTFRPELRLARTATLCCVVRISIGCS
jgi:hypothetical protein